MIKKSKFLLCELLLIILVLSGCASGSENDTVESGDSDNYAQIEEEEQNDIPDNQIVVEEQEISDNQEESTEQETPENQDESSEQKPSDIQDAIEEWKAGNELSDEELNYFTDFFQSDENYGFLLSDYTTPTDVNLNEVFYCGAGIAAHTLTDDVKAAYEKETGWPIELDVESLSTKQIDDFLMEKTGYSLEEMNKPLSWTYLEQYDSYVSQHGDTNYISFACVSGKRIEEDVFELKYQSATYGVVTLRKNGENYLFISNQKVYIPDLSGLSAEEIKQLEVFAENKDVWNMNGYESIAYTVVDLDNDGILELIINAKDGIEGNSENHFYNTDDKFTKIEELPQEYYEEDSEFDIAANIFDRYKEAYTDGNVIYYPASDKVKNGSKGTYFYEGAYYLKEGIVHSVIYRSQYALKVDENSYEHIWYDARGNEISEKEWIKLYDAFYAGMESITNPVFWLWIEPSEIEQAPDEKMLDILAGKYKDGLERLAR